MDEMSEKTLELLNRIELTLGRMVERQSEVIERIGKTLEAMERQFASVSGEWKEHWTVGVPEDEERIG